MAAKGNAAVIESVRKAVSESTRFTPQLETDFQKDRSVVLSCLNSAIDDANEKREALASSAGMSAGQFSKVTADDVERQGLHKVLDALPQDIFVDFMKRFGEARGLKVREQDTAELTEEFMAAVDRMVAIGTLLRIKKPKAAKAGL